MTIRLPHFIFEKPKIFVGSTFDREWPSLLLSGRLRLTINQLLSLLLGLLGVHLFKAFALFYLMKCVLAELVISYWYF